MPDLKKSMSNNKIHWGAIRRDGNNPPLDPKNKRPNFKITGMKPKKSTEKKSA